MDLIYADAQRIDIGVIHDYKFDLAFGKDENNFELELPLVSHCCEEGYHLYIEGTEYGGIVDKIRVDTSTDKVVYSGRTWHGILAGRVIEPDAGADYYTVTGDANEVLAELIELLGLSDIFSASTDESDIDIGQYSFRYVDGYSGICAMLAENDGKLLMEYHKNSVVLSAVYLTDYSQDEEWDSTQVEFEIEKDYRPVNHLICLGSGELKNRYVIHLFTDENGGVQPYATTDEPMSDADYILTRENQLLFGSSEVADVYDYGSVGTTENFEVVTTEPASWNKVYKNYYTQNEDGSYSALEADEADVYVLQVQQPYDWAVNYSDYFTISNSAYVAVESATVYTLQTAKPSDWTSNYEKYFRKSGSSYISVTSVESVTYKKQTKKPSDWSKKYKNYYYFYSDGVTSEYLTVPGVTKYKYKVQTRKPTDWATEYGSYYVKKKKGGYDEVSAVIKNGKETAPKWKAKKYYTKQSYQVAPNWKKGTYYTSIRKEVVPTWASNTYYTKSINNVPTWASNKYYTLTTKILTPRFISGFYYAKKLDHFAELVAGGIARLKESFDCDSIQIKLDLEGTYDIGDIVGTNENTTGISVWQPITKKIVTIQKNKETITYEIG